MELRYYNPFDRTLLFKRELWIKDYSTRMQRMLNNERIAPIRIDAEPHRQCNLRCLHCVRSRGNNSSIPAGVDDERWYEIARESGKMGVKAWNIAGISEPMMRAEMTLKLMSIIKEQGMFGELTTNGTLWNESHMHRVIEMAWDSVAVSIDAPDAETHDKIRGQGGVFRKACDTVKMLSGLRRKNRTDLPNLTVNLVLNQLNYEKLPQMVELAHKLGADALFVEPMVVYTDHQKQNLCLKPEQREKLKSSVEEAGKLGYKRNVYVFATCMEGDDEKKEFNPELAEKGGELKQVIRDGTEKQADRYAHHIANNEKFIHSIMNIPCYYPWFYMMVTAEGNAVHCGECSTFAGNIKEKSLKEIWFGENMQEFRRMYLKGNLPDFCNRCRPNIISDMKIVRKSIIEYSSAAHLQESLFKLHRKLVEVKQRER